MKKILIFGVGGPTPRAFAKSIKIFGGSESDNYSFIGVDCNPLAYGLYDQNIFTKTFLIPEVGNQNYWDTINTIIDNENIDGAIVLPEKEVLEWSKNATSNLNKKIKLYLPNYDLAINLVDKHTLYTNLIGTNLIPKFCKVDAKNYSYSEIVKIVNQPFWIRATEGSSGFGAFKIIDEKHLEAWFILNSNIESFLASEYLPKRNLACKMLFLNNKLIATASNERINYVMAKTAPSGITGNVSFAKLINDDRLQVIGEKALKIISQKTHSEINGIFTIDFKEDENGEPKITEINIRYIATVACYAKGGSNIPLDQLKIMFGDFDLNSEIPKNYHFEEGLVFFREVDEYPILINEKEILK